MSFIPRFLAFSVCFTTSIIAPAVSAQQDPERATGIEKKALVTGKRYMVAAANPHAAEMGLRVLAQGGSAIDAAVAIQAGLNLVEPQSSGIGGGAFILYWDAKTKKLHTFDARETAPAAATAELFIENGKALAWRDAIVGGRAVGVPGVVKGLETVHQRYGRLPWKSLFDDAIALAEKGFKVSPRLARLLDYRFHPGLTALDPAKSYFYPDDKALKAGTVLKNPDLASSLRLVAHGGSKAFYEGPLAKEIVAAVHGSKIRPGLLSLDDMKRYAVIEREALCGGYRDFRLCGMGLPSSGGLAVLQIMGVLDRFSMAELGPNDPLSWHLFTQASRLAYADRDRYAADPDFVEVPVAALLSRDYLGVRAKLVDPKKDMKKAQPGLPVVKAAWADDDSYELPSTSHLVVVDDAGNAVSMTTSIEMAFGSSLMVGGFLLNNQLTDFSLSPTREGKPVANRVEAGKRPRSSMAPMMVFDPQGDLSLALGSPGGSRIINYVAKTLVGVLDWDLSIQEAINLPNVTHRNDYTAVEQGQFSDSMIATLKKWGHDVRASDLNSGVHAIQIQGDTLNGGADPRREGLVLSR